MEIITYIIERLVDIIAALILRAGYRLIDQFFAAMGVNVEVGDLWVPLGTPVRTGSGGVLSTIGGGETRRDSTGGQPVDGSGDVTGGDSLVVDFPGL